MSHDKNFVKQYFPKSEIKNRNRNYANKQISWKDFSKLKIDSFSIDVEGLDYKIFMDMDLKKFDIYRFSIEYFHLNKKSKKNIIKKFIKMVIRIMDFK